MGTGLYLCLGALVGMNILIQRRLLKAAGVRRSKSPLWNGISFGGFGLAILWLIAGAAFSGLPSWPAILLMAVSFLSDVLRGYLMLKNAKPVSP